VFRAFGQLRALKTLLIKFHPGLHITDCSQDHKPFGREEVYFVEDEQSKTTMLPIHGRRYGYIISTNPFGYSSDVEFFPIQDGLEPRVLAIIHFDKISNAVITRNKLQIRLVHPMFMIWYAFNSIRSVWHVHYRTTKISVVHSGLSYA
jgi:hypothetical protein